jgi:hypothetical protein
MRRPGITAALALVAAASLGAGIALAQAPAPAPAPAPAAAPDGTVQRSMVFSNGDTFTGAFRNGLPNGPGTFRTADGKTHTGEWRDGCLLNPREYRVAVLTALKDCDPAPRRKPALPRIDMR